MSRRKDSEHGKEIIARGRRTGVGGRVIRDRISKYREEMGDVNRLGDQDHSGQNMEHDMWEPDE